MDIITTAIILLIGFFTGIATGLTGASGVMVVVPLTNLLLGMPVHIAIGTSLMADVIASCAVSWTYYRHGNTDIRSGFWVAIGSIFGAQVSAGFAVAIPENGLGMLFGGGMIISSVIMARRGTSEVAEGYGGGSFFNFKSDTMRYAMATFLGYLLGTMTGIFGSGGGIMIFLVLFFVLKFPVKKAIGTSTMIMAITAASGCFGYAMHGKIDMAVGLMIGFSAVAGGSASARLANRINEKYLLWTLVAVFIILGVIMTTVGFSRFNDHYHFF